MTTDDLLNYFQKLRKKKYSNSSIKNKLSALKSFYFVLKSVGEVKNDPTLEVKFTHRRGKRKCKMDKKKGINKS